MMLLSAWQPTADFDASKDQRVRTLYLPNAGEYRSVYWNRSSTDGASVLSGAKAQLLGDAPSAGSIFAGLAIAAVGIFAAVKIFGGKERGHLSGARRRKRR